MKGFFCYKWVVDDDVVYIGKTVNPESRFYQEMREDKFAPYLDADIYIVEFPNASEMDAIEKLLINKYQPDLNVKEKHIEHSESLFDDGVLTWKKFYTPKHDADTSMCKFLRKKKLIDKLKDQIEENRRRIKDGSFYIKVFGYIDGMIANNIKDRTLLLDMDDSDLKKSFSMDIPGDVILDIVGDSITLTEEERDKVGLLYIRLFTWPDGKKVNINISMDNNLDFFFTEEQNPYMFKIFKIMIDEVWEEIDEVYEEIEKCEKLINEQEGSDG